MTALDWVSIVVGAALVLTGLYEVYRTLLHPTGRGRITRGVASAIWFALRRFGRRGPQMAGPLVTLAVVLTWTALQIVGWAFIYLPAVPAGFAYSQGVSSGEYLPLLESLYVSMVTLSTLGIGDVTPVYPWVRMLTPIESLFGFALLTAAVSWFMELYPGIGRRRALALRISLLERSEAHREVGTMDAGAASALLAGLASDLAQAQVDLSQNEEVFYFSSGRRSTSLAATLSYCLVLARQAGRSPHNAVVLAGRVLEKAVADYAAFLRDDLHLAGDTTEHILLEYSRQHGFRD